jgi:hypothetical protein
MNIFVSRPNWVPAEFESGLTTFLLQMENLGLTPRTLGVSDYPSKSPLDEVIEIMGVCKGAVVLGYPQIEIQSGIIKGSNIQSPIALGTEWNHLEAGLAYAAGLPLLVVHHPTVSRGIFDRGVLNAFLHSVDLSSPNWSMQPSLNGAIQKWKQACMGGSANYVGAKRAVAGPAGTPSCPNCSTASKQIFMSPVPPPFNELAGGNWECSACKFVQ